MDTSGQNAAAARTRIGRMVEEFGLHTVRVGAVDLDGIWRGKQVPSTYFLDRVWQDGVHMGKAVLGMTVTDEMIPGLGFTDLDSGLPDVHVLPDLSTFARAPGTTGIASVICDFVETDGTPTAISPRQVLREVLTGFQDRGLEPRIGYELEFYLFDNPWDSARENGYAGLTPLSPDLRTYNLAQLGRLEPIIGDIVAGMTAAGVPIEAANTEFSPSQFELNLRHTGALDAADHVVRFKAGVREIAESHGAVATFMAKYDDALGGSSGHIHQSLWDSRGHNTFAGPDGGLSAVAGHYLAGQLATMADCTALFCPTVNSYKRTVPNTGAPTTATWGRDNRTAGLRTLTGTPSAARIEHRRPGADANPYLAIAACLAGGLHGIEHELEPPPPVTGNAYELPADHGSTLPGTLEEAVARLDRSKLARELLGEAFVEHFLATRRAEIAACRTAVTDWERKRYFDLIELRLGEGLIGWVAQHRKATLIGRAAWKDPRWKRYPVLNEEGLESAMLAPILLPNGERLGVIALCSTRTDHFTTEHLNVLTEITGLLATVIEKIRMDEELTRWAKVLSFLGQLCGRLSSARPPEELMDSAAALTAEVMAAGACLIVTADRGEGRFVLRGLAPNRAEAIPEIDGRLGALVDAGTDVTSNEQLFRDLALALPERFAEVSSAPLLAGHDHLGFITCYRHQRYSSADRELLAVIAGQVALGLLALEGADLAEQDGVAELFDLLAGGRNESVVMSLAASLGVDLHQPHVLLRARLVPTGGSRNTGVIADRFARAAEQFIRGIEEQSPHSLVRESRGGVVGLVRLTRLTGGATFQQRLQTAVDELAARWGISVSCGLSSTCGGPPEYVDAYREAAEALEIGSKLRGEGHVVRFEELGPDLYLFRMAADPRTRRDPWLRTLLPLIDYDRRTGSALLATLDAYLEGRGNASLTAEQLGVHRNTLRQRLARIEHLTGTCLAETPNWLPLHFAVKLARMREGGAR